MRNLLEQYKNKKIKLDGFKDNNKCRLYTDFIKDNNKQYSLEEVLNIIDCDKVLQEIKNIKEDFIYNSDIHSIRHNERVIFFSSIICFMENIIGRDYSIIMDGARYHDIGRINDDVDPLHGLRSARMIDQVLPDYNEEDLRYLKGIIEIHSIDDSSNIDRICNKYNLEINRFKKLYKVLKDADNLDRVRLDEFADAGFTWLDPKYLRCETSHKMVTLAYEINYYTKR